MNSSDNSYLIQVLNYSVFQEIIHIKQIFDTILEKNFTFLYQFDHNPQETESEKAVNTTELHNCNCLYDCQSFPFIQASQYPKSYTEFYKSILLRDRLDVQTTTGFGINTIFQLLNQLEETNRFFESNKNDKNNTETMKLQAGGGSGFGFQMYCDNTVILTVGGGGGGGYYFDDESQSFNVVAGGGAGMQFANLTDIMIRHHPKELRNSSLLSNLTFHSIGGGGGCGTCADPTDDIHSCTLAKKLFTNSYDTILTCGFKKDDDALDDTTLRQLLSSFRQFTSECREITIYGGGGGGGGTSLCCQPFHIGYGFSFSLHYVNDPNLPQSEMFYNFHSEQEESKSSEVNEFRISHDKSSFNTTSGPVNIYPSKEMRYQYDFIGKLLHDSSTICNGFGSWCCVCNATQVVIKDCLKLNLTVSDYSTRKNLTAIDFTCRDIQINYARISWLVDQSCCHNYETKDEVSTTSLEHEGEEDHDNVIVINETILNNYYQFYQIPKSLFLSSLQKRGKSFYHIIVNLHENGDKFISTDRSVTDPHNIHNGSSTIERSQNHFNLFHYKNQTLIKLLQEFQSNPIFNTHTNKTIINNSEIFRCQKNINYYSDRIISFPYDYSNFDTILMKPSNNSTNTSFFFSNSSQLDLFSSVFDSNMFSMASSTVYRCGSLFIFILLLIFLICQLGELIKRIKERISSISIAVKDDRLKHDILRPPSLSQEYPSNKYGSV